MNFDFDLIRWILVGAALAVALLALLLAAVSLWRVL